MSPASLSPASPPPEGPKRLSLRERRQANRKKWRNRAIGVLVLAGSLVVAEKQLDISGRVSRTLDDRPAALRTFIREFSDTEFVAQRMQENNAYFEKKGVIDETRRNALAETLTRLDILVQGYLEPGANITEHDLLAYVL